MSSNQLFEGAKSKLTQAQNHFGEELKKLRTGRAHPSMLDGVVVAAYGSSMPLIQLATVTAPEPQLLQITPFDPSTIQAIASAIRDNQSLGFNPIDDGRVVRVPVPALTTERRQSLVKMLKEKMEDTFVQMRNARHDALNAGKQEVKDKTMSEDDQKRLEKQVEELMQKTKTDIEAMAKAKEQEIMTL